MMLSWIGLALLSASWLLGPGYYHPADWPAWTVTVVLGTVLLAAKPTRLPDRRQPYPRGRPRYPPTPFVQSLSITSCFPAWGFLFSPSAPRKYLGRSFALPSGGLHTSRAPDSEAA